MSRESMTAKRFAAKVEWEGGILDALDYGLKHTDLDPDDADSADLRAAWKELEEKYASIAPTVSRLEAILEDLESTEGDS